MTAAEYFLYMSGVLLLMAIVGAFVLGEMHTFTVCSFLLGVGIPIGLTVIDAGAAFVLAVANFLKGL